jgi:hypothetical protein
MFPLEQNQADKIKAGLIEKAFIEYNEKNAIASGIEKKSYEDNKLSAGSL